MILRKAVSGDADDLLQWRNDPHTRAMSRTPTVVEPQEHMAWFERVLADPAAVLLIGEDGGRKAGMVRLDRGERVVVSININPECRGLGYGLALLTEALAQVSDEVWAEIKDDNLASQRLFRRAGFEPVGGDGGFGHYRRRGG